MAIANFLAFASILLTYTLMKDWWVENTGIHFEPPLVVDGSFKNRLSIVLTLFFYTGLLATPFYLSTKVLNKNLAFKKLKAMPFRLVLLNLFIGLSLFKIDQNIHSPFNGNLFSAFGVFQENEVLLGSRPEIYPLFFRILLTLFGLYYLVPFILRESEIIKRKDIFLYFKDLKFGAVSAGVSLLYLCILVYRGIFFDRYYLPLLPGLLIVLANLFNYVQIKQKPILSFISIFFIFAFTLTICKDYFEWNKTKWTLAEWTKSQNIPSQLVDGGYEWNGWNGKIESAHPALAIRTAKYFLSYSQVNNFKIVRTEDWYSIWPPHDRKIYLLEVPRQ
jgi:hypothetical protein